MATVPLPGITVANAVGRSTTGPSLGPNRREGGRTLLLVKSSSIMGPRGGPIIPLIPTNEGVGPTKEENHSHTTSHSPGSPVSGSTVASVGYHSVKTTVQNILEKRKKKFLDR